MGVGDDAALLRLPSQELVVTTDMLMDGVDFELAACGPRRAGRKALAVNLSDLAAMAARPEAAFISLALPRDGALELAIELFEGIIPLAEEFEIAIAGGDTNVWSGALALSITAIGSLEGCAPWLRSGARPGDAILVSGEFGGSILGRHFDFTPRVREALDAASRFAVHAAIDVSDGLSLDLSRLALASGVGAAIDLSQIPVSAAARELAAREVEGERAAERALEHALGDGEDFELILAVSQDDAAKLLEEPPPGEPALGVRWSRIGEIVAEGGLWSVSGDGRAPLLARGFVH